MKGRQRERDTNKGVFFAFGEAGKINIERKMEIVC